MKKAERLWMDAVASCPCAACGNEPVHVHHIREGQGMGQRSSSYLTVALCPECHQGDFSIHMSKEQFVRVYGSELNLLAKTIEMVAAKRLKNEYTK